MVIYGMVVDPTSLVVWMKDKNIKFSFNRLKLFYKVAVFSSAKQMILCSKQIGKRCVIVFDSIERLNSIKGVKLIDKSNLHELQQVLTSQESFTGGLHGLVISKMDVIKSTILSNKDNGLLNIYNTSIYAIKAKDTREQLKDLILSYVSGEMSKDNIQSILKEFHEIRRNSSTKAVIMALSDMLATEQFDSTRTSVMTLLKSKTLLDRDHIEQVSLANKVEAYDVNYFYAKALAKRTDTKK